jgi:hypothetical protein
MVHLAVANQCHCRRRRIIEILPQYINIKALGTINRISEDKPLSHPETTIGFKSALFLSISIH